MSNRGTIFVLQPTVIAKKTKFSWFFNLFREENIRYENVYLMYSGRFLGAGIFNEIKNAIYLDPEDNSIVDTDNINLSLNNQIDQFDIGSFRVVNEQEMKDIADNSSYAVIINPIGQVITSIPDKNGSFYWVTFKTARVVDAENLAEKLGYYSIEKFGNETY